MKSATAAVTWPGLLVMLTSRWHTSDLRGYMYLVGGCVRPHPPAGMPSVLGVEVSVTALDSVHPGPSLPALGIGDVLLKRVLAA